MQCWTYWTPVAFLTLPILGAVALSTLLGSGGTYIAYRRSRVARSRRRAQRATRPILRAHQRHQGFLARQRQKIQDATPELRTSQQSERREVAPVTELREFGASGIRWQSLADAGIDTVGDLRKRNREELVALDGIGDKSAANLEQAAAAFDEHVQREPMRPPRPALDEPGARRLMQEVLRLARFRRALGPSAAQLQATATRLEKRQEDVEQRSGFWRWLFGLRSPEQREAVISDADELAQDAQQVNETDLVPDFEARFQEAVTEARESRSAAQLAREYKENHTTATSTLSQALAAAPSSSATADGGKRPSSIAEADLDAIEATALHSEAMSIGLRKYQEFGTKFMLTQGRTVLGDEMGLGKTVQALAAMAQVWATQGPAYFLVIAPAGILINWKRETEDKSFLLARIARGAHKERTVAEWLEQRGVLVISYATLRSFDLAEQLRERETRIDFLVADEAHYVKNPEAQRTQVVADLTDLSERVCFMTGTPMENHPREFVHLIETLGTERFRLNEDHVDDPESQATSERFREEVAGFYLRRNQEDVLHELPEKIVVPEWIELTSAERRNYAEAVAEGQFMQMRQRVTIGAEGTSAKLDRLEELLEEHGNAGRKVLVFSYFLQVLEAVATRFGGVGTIHGGVPQDRRAELIDEFGAVDDAKLLLAQITAAGHGLNLQMASVVVLLEPQLTPGAEAQAIARAHRMGQTERVVVHRFLAADTVDERIVELLRHKEGLFDEYARHSVTKEENPEATETQVIRKIIQLEQERLRATPPSTSSTP